MENEKNILKSIDYFLKVKNYLVNDIPMINYEYHNVMLGLLVEKLNTLEIKYRSSSGNSRFTWSKYQFENERSK